MLLLSLGVALATPSDEFLRWSAGQSPPAWRPDRAAGWRFAADIWGELAERVADKPGVIQAFRAGSTVEQRPIWGFRVHAPGEPVRARILVIAQLHALEWIGAEVATELLTELADAPEGAEVVVLPIVNADGRYRVEQDLLAGELRYRRANAEGVDLNRDFAVNRENDVIWSRLPPTAKYYGTSPAPLSQPESRAVDRVAAEGFDAVVSLHSFGGYIYVPWAGLWSPPEHYSEMITSARNMAAAMPGRAYQAKQLCHWIFFFRALGSELDHFYGRYGSDAYLMELTRTGLTLDRDTWHDPFRLYNPVDPQPTVEDGVAALLWLVRHQQPVDRARRVGGM